MVSATGSSVAPTLEADGQFGYARLHCDVSGPETGEPILLLHGWGSSAANMSAISEALSDSYRVYNLDLPGHGLSPAPPDGLGVPEHAALVADLIRDRIGPPVTIVGHSNGGRIALYMASEPAMKALIKRLVLISPSGVTPQRPPSYYIKKYTARALKAPFEFLPPKLREFGLDWLRHSLVWRLLGSTDYRALEGSMRGTFVKTVTHHLDDRLREIEVPTLLIWGDRDTAISRYQMQVLEKNIRDAGVVVLEGAGHYSYLDDFDRFIGATRYFLHHS